MSSVLSLLDDVDDETTSSGEDDEGELGKGGQCCCRCQIESGKPQRVRFARLQQVFCRLLRCLIYTGTVLLSLARVQYVLTKSTDKHEMAWTIGGAFVVATVPISLYQIFGHLTNFVEPKQQTHVIRMISMVPLYAIQSWFSLRYPFLSLYTQCLREAYEAYVIYAFVQYLISYMGNEEQLVAKLHTKPAVLGRHMAPFCCLPPWQMGAEFLHKCKMGVLQYLGIRSSTTALTFILEHFDLYGEGEYSVKRGFFWVTLINCCSQTFALYVLVLFYHATHKELVDINPLPKFASIKGVVFASWWQSLLIGLMVHQGTIGELDSHSAEMVAKGVQDLLICSEMLMAAIAFTFTFPVSDFVPTEPLGFGQHAHWQSEEALKSLDENAGGQGPEAVPIWSALWTTCVPLDVREEFRQAAMQCRDDDTQCMGCLSEWCLTMSLPCRCKLKWSGPPHTGRSTSPKKAKVQPRTPRGGGGTASRTGSGSGSMRRIS